MMKAARRWNFGRLYYYELAFSCMQRRKKDGLRARRERLDQAKQKTISTHGHQGFKRKRLNKIISDRTIVAVSGG